MYLDFPRDYKIGKFTFQYIRASYLPKHFDDDGDFQRCFTVCHRNANVKAVASARQISLFWIYPRVITLSKID